MLQLAHSPQEEELPPTLAAEALKQVLVQLGQEMVPLLVLIPIPQRQQVSNRPRQLMVLPPARVLPPGLIPSLGLILWLRLILSLGLILRLRLILLLGLILRLALILLARQILVLQLRMAPRQHRHCFHLRRFRLFLYPLTRWRYRRRLRCL